MMPADTNAPRSVAEIAAELMGARLFLDWAFSARNLPGAPPFFCAACGLTREAVLDLADLFTTAGMPPAPFCCEPTEKEN